MESINMNFSFGGLVGSMMVSGAGFVFFRYGRKRSRPIFLIFGIIMMVYPYFIDDWAWMLGIFAGMCALLYWLKQKGY